MSGVDSGGSVLNLQELQWNDLVCKIALQHREVLAKNERLRASNYETALRRAEARIAYLNEKLGIGPQTTFGIDVVNPGISGKDYDAVTKENIRLKEALEHIVPTELGGKDIVIKNRELYELVTTLRDDLAQYEHHIKELETILASKEDDLAVKVNHLTKQNMKLGRLMQAKQVFSEKLLKENKRLNEIVDQQKGLMVVDRDVPDGQAIDDKMNVDENATTSATNAISNKEQERIMEEKEKVISEQARKIQELLTKIEDASKQIAELSTEVAKTNEGKQKVESELSETAKKCADFQKRCTGFFNQVESLNSKQQEVEEEISSQKGSCENLRAQLAEKEAMMVMMRDSLKTYEDDFRRENEEKAGIQKRMETAQQESERLRRENQSHMTTIRHFESEIERMSKLLTDEKNRNKITTSFQPGFGQRCGSNVSRSFFHDRTSQPIAVADCGVGGVNMPTQEEGASSKTIIEEKDRIISEQRTKMDQMQEENENLKKQVAELTSESLEEKPRAHGAEGKGTINMMGFQYLANCTFAN